MCVRKLDGISRKDFIAIFKNKYYFKIYYYYKIIYYFKIILRSLYIFEDRMKGNFLETSRKKLNLQFLFDVSLLVSPFRVSFYSLLITIRAYIAFFFLFFSKNNSVFSLFLYHIYHYTFLFFIYRAKYSDIRRNYNDQNGKFYRSHANLEFRLLLP